MLKYIPHEWREDMRTNFAHSFNFYLNPRCRVIPALTSAGVTYIKNTSATNDNFRGTYRLQASGTTSLTYLYTMSQRFIIEGWFKPEFAYNVAGDQTIFSCGDAAEFSIIYNATTDKFDMIQSPGTTISSTAFTADTQLQCWLYLRAWYDNTAKLAGFYLWRNTDEIFCNTENVPGAGAFVPLNTISFFPTVTLESSYWIIHELDEALPPAEYKTYKADRQVMFDFNGTTLARERIRIPRSVSDTDFRGVKYFNLSKSVENPMTGSAGANTAGLTIYNNQGQFADDQYDAFDPFQGYYNGTLYQKYLQNRVPVEIESQYVDRSIPLYPSDTLYPSNTLYPSGPLGTSSIEPVFIGRTTQGAFKRNSPNKFASEVTIEVEDGIAELGETKLDKAYAYDAHDICDPAAETNSLVHDIVRIVTKKEIRNFALNSSFENATIANSWTNSGMAAFYRSNTYAQFGTYSMKCVADAAGDKVTQVIKFETTDLIDVGDTFNFSAFVRQGTASTVKIQIEELTSAGALVGTASETACGTDTGVFTRVNVSRTILASTCTQLRITFYAVAASTFYVDGVMLTRGYDPLDYFLVNATDGASGSGSADSAATYLYDTVAIDADAVDIQHPYALLDKGSSPWEALKDIGNASIVYYIGMTPDGVFRFKVRYAGNTPATNGSIDDISGVATSLEVNTCNAIKVHGVVIERQTGTATTMKQVWNAKNAGGFTLDEGGMLNHPIADGDYLTVAGATKIEAIFSEDIK
jgi:hypothetical protein